MANSIEEVRVMQQAAKAYGRVVQVGQWQRSGKHWQDAMEYLWSGELGLAPPRPGPTWVGTRRCPYPTPTRRKVSTTSCGWGRTSAGTGSPSPWSSTAAAGRCWPRPAARTVSREDAGGSETGRDPRSRGLPQHTQDFIDNAPRSWWKRAAFRTGRRVYWDLAAGRFAGDDEANALLSTTTAGTPATRGETPACTETGEARV